MGWWVAIIVWIGSLVAGRLLRRRPHVPVPEPGNFDASNMPTASEARPVPVVWGTVRLDSPNVLWYGGQTTREVKQDGQVVGHRYYLTLQYGLCIGPIDKVLAIEWDGLRPTPYCSAFGWTYDEFFYRQSGLFGGNYQEGGIFADIRAYKGKSFQEPDSHLADKIGAPVPGYPHLAYLVMRGLPYPHSEIDPCIYFRTHLPGEWLCPCPEYDVGTCVDERAAYVGTAPILHPMAVEVQRVGECNPLGLIGGDIHGDANPANMIYEILHDTIWGLGIADEDGIDKASFIAAGEALWSEGFGLSMIMDQAKTAKEVIDEILRHIDGVLALDPDTGLVQLRLIRGDYLVDELPEFGPNEIHDFHFTRPSLDTLSNSVRVTYPDRSEHYKVVVVTAQDLANIQQRGEEVVEDVTYQGISNSALAQRLAARDLKVLSYPWAQMSFNVDRSAWNLRQGSPFVLDWPDLGISGMVCRVTRISPGDLTKGEISIDAIEDVFGVSWTAFGPIPPSEWEDPYQGE